MDKRLFVEKREFEALERAHSQTRAMLESSKTECQKLKKQISLYTNKHNVILSELNIKIQQLSREKMMAEGLRNTTEILKKTAQIEALTQAKNMFMQKIFM